MELGVAALAAPGVPPGTATAPTWSTDAAESPVLAAAGAPASALVESKCNGAAIGFVDQSGLMTHVAPAPMRTTSATNAAKPAAEPALPGRRVVGRRGTPRLAYGRRAGMRWAAV